MSTHRWFCVVCGRPTYCSNDEHALGASDSCCCKYERDEGKPIGVEFFEDENYTAKPVEFCSVACFKALAQRMAERWRLCSTFNESGNGLDPFDGRQFLGLAPGDSVPSNLWDQPFLHPKVTELPPPPSV